MNGCEIKPVAVFLVLNWCCAVHGSDKMALRTRRVMARAKARAKARAIVVYIYSYGASLLILWLNSVSSTLGPVSMR